MIYVEQIIEQLLQANPSIGKVSLVEFPPTVILQDRIVVTKKESEAIDNALKIRNELDVPFWDSILLTQFNVNVYSPSILKEAALHNTLNSKTFFTVDKWQAEAGSVLMSEKYFGFNSCVKLNDNSSAHIPLFDFHIPAKESNIPCVLEVLSLLGLKGYLLQTNKSFHFYGNMLLSPSVYMQLLYKALLFSPIIDKNWITHQLIEGSATLRITEKDGQRPFLIQSVE